MIISKNKHLIGFTTEQLRWLSKALELWNIDYDRNDPKKAWSDELIKQVDRIVINEQYPEWQQYD